MTNKLPVRYTPTREKVNKLAKPFLVLQCEALKTNYLIPRVADLPQADTIRTIRGNKCHTVKAFADEVSAAFQFIGLYRDNWDVFNEYMNDLDWLPPVTSYLIIFTHTDELLADEPFQDFWTLMKILESTADNWEWGTNHKNIVRAYQEEVVPQSTKFSILFQHEKDVDLSTNFGKWLSEGNKLVEASFNLSSVLDTRPFLRIKKLRPVGTKLLISNCRYPGYERR